MKRITIIFITVFFMALAMAHAQTPGQAALPGAADNSPSVDSKSPVSKKSAVIVGVAEEQGDVIEGAKSIVLTPPPDLNFATELVISPDNTQVLFSMAAWTKSPAGPQIDVSKNEFWLYTVEGAQWAKLDRQQGRALSQKWDGGGQGLSKAERGSFFDGYQCGKSCRGIPQNITSMHPHGIDSFIKSRDARMIIYKYVSKVNTARHVPFIEPVQAQDKSYALGICSADGKRNRIFAIDDLHALLEDSRWASDNSFVLIPRTYSGGSGQVFYLLKFSDEHRAADAMAQGSDGGGLRVEGKSWAKAPAESGQMTHCHTQCDNSGNCTKSCEEVKRSVCFDTCVARDCKVTCEEIIP